MLHIFPLLHSKPDSVRFHRLSRIDNGLNDDVMSFCEAFRSYISCTFTVKNEPQRIVSIREISPEALLKLRTIFVPVPSCDLGVTGSG